MDKDFEKYQHLTEMFGPDITGLGMKQSQENPELESMWKKLDTMNSTINSIRDSMRKCMDADAPKDKALYASIVEKYMSLIDKLWNDVKEQMLKEIEEEPEEMDKAIIIKRYPEE